MGDIDLGATLQTGVDTVAHGALGSRQRGWQVETGGERGAGDQLGVGLPSCGICSHKGEGIFRRFGSGPRSNGRPWREPQHSTQLRATDLVG